MLPPIRSSSQLAADAPSALTWVWHGLLARGGVTLLSSHWKAGKTTLLSVLLAKRGRGGSLAGRAVEAGRSVVVSEEAPALWNARCRALGIGDHVGWLCRPFRGKPDYRQWLGLIDRLGDAVADGGVDLVVIDPLASFLPGRDESQPAVMIEALAPLHRLTAAGCAVLLQHHTRRTASLVGSGCRGSGALPGFADIVLELDWVRRGCPDDRRRRLSGLSRFGETPATLLLELNQAGTDYDLVTDHFETDFNAAWPTLRRLLLASAHPLTRQEIRILWPAASERPSPSTLWKWLGAAVADGLVSTEGGGRRGDPFRFRLAPKAGGARTEHDLLRELLGGG